MIIILFATFIVCNLLQLLRVFSLRVLERKSVTWTHFVVISGHIFAGLYFAIKNAFRRLCFDGL